MRSLLLVVPVLAIGCYNPLPQSGVQQCGPNGECEAGYYCAADKRCYKNGDKPKMDASVPSDMATPCTADTCKAMSKVCDPDTHGCVDCLQDGDCPLGKVCQQKACVDGCNDMHGCPSGMCKNGMCSACKANGDCTDPSLPKCDVASGRCVACLMTSDCGAGQFCDPGDHACHMGCDTDAQCTTDAGNANMKCCNHVCYDLNSSNGHCGDCGTDCGNQTCCAGICSDTMNGDLMNCGGCGIACQGQRAMWACMNAACTVIGCSPGFKDCDTLANDGCEVNVNSDANNCGGCGVKCSVPNAMGQCVNGACSGCGCTPGFSDCNKDCKDGCEININGDPNNCGGCGNVCNLAHAMSGCVGGKCVITGCAAGYANCNNIDSDGCEVAVASDANNCGNCGVKCNGIPNGTPSCVNSTCVPSCSAGFKDCNGIYADGCEANLNTDVANCGGCGRACSGANVAAKACAGGLCTSTCAAGFGNCVRPVAPGADDGCETNTTNNNSNCGACGVMCMNAQTCANSMCGGAQVLVGQFAVNAGPLWTNNPPCYTCQETCAMLFGGLPGSYSCSTVNNMINHLASVDGWGDNSHCGMNYVAETYKAGMTYNCGAQGCSYSAYVSDHGCAAINYCWR